MGARSLPDSIVDADAFGASDDARRVRRLDGNPFKAFTISSRPRRSAIRMVAELKLLVDSSSSLRSLAGISPTERYTWVGPRFAIKMVDVLTLTRCINCL